MTTTTYAEEVSIAPSGAMLFVERAVVKQPLDDVAHALIQLARAEVAGDHQPRS